MKNHNNSFTEKLLGQESVDSQFKSDYEKRIASIMDHKNHWLTRTFYVLVALVGILFSLSIVRGIFRLEENELDVFMKAGEICLLLCVAYYSCLAAAAAIRGNVPLRTVTPVILGAVVLSGFFFCMRFFWLYILPALSRFGHDATEGLPVLAAWSVAGCFMIIIMIMFGVLAVGVTFILHLLHKHHRQDRQKLLEIELALAELTEKKAGISS
jgi:hypothetical protein